MEKRILKQVCESREGWAYWIWGPWGSCSIGVWFSWYGASREDMLKELWTQRRTVVTSAACLKHELGCSFHFLNPVKAAGKGGNAAIAT